MSDCNCFSFGHRGGPDCSTDISLRDQCTGHCWGMGQCGPTTVSGICPGGGNAPVSSGWKIYKKESSEGGLTTEDVTWWCHFRRNGPGNNPAADQLYVYV